MFLIGIDEAGYGPSLGPLCHGVAAFAVPGNDPKPPDLYALLHPLVQRFPPDPPTALCVDDSKKVYTGLGLEGLAMAVSSFGALNLPAEDLTALTHDPWGHGLEMPSSAIQTRAVSEKLASNSVQLVLLAARALSARGFNARLAELGAEKNKADLNWERAATCLRQALEACSAHSTPNEPFFISIDRQGGRKFYLGPLSEFFNGAFVQTLEETSSCSAYALEWNGHPLRIEFRTESESQNLPVALASMAAKLTRELCMERFNAYFLSRQPDLKPTAGYPQDAKRFLKDIKKLRQEPGHEDAVLIRKK